MATILHMDLNHLELPGSYIRLLFVIYSSAFNTIIPDILVEKLAGLKFLPPHLLLDQDLPDKPATGCVFMGCLQDWFPGERSPKIYMFRLNRDSTLPLGECVSCDALGATQREFCLCPLDTKLEEQ